MRNAVVKERAWFGGERKKGIGGDTPRAEIHSVSRIYTISVDEGFFLCNLTGRAQLMPNDKTADRRRWERP